MLEISGLSTRAGSFVLSNVSIAVPPSSCHVIVGPTGSGKTLLLESVIGLRKPDNGRVLLDGREITYLPIESRRLSYVPQDLALFPHMTVRENIFYPMRIRGINGDAESGMAWELVDSLGIRRLLDRRTMNLSGGERQRTALARAVASGYKHLVLDEPLSALHESLKRELWYLLRDLQRRYDLAILMVTHDLEEAFFLGDTLSVILDGKVHQQGAQERVYACPASVEVADFLGIRNLFHVTTETVDASLLRAHCEDLGVTLTLPAPARTPNSAEPSSYVVAIRSEDVVILAPGDVSPSTANVVVGTIQEIMETGPTLTIIATCGSRSKQIEISVRRSLGAGLSLDKGHSIMIRLPEENISLIGPDSSNDPQQSESDFRPDFALRFRSRPTVVQGN